MPRVASYNVRHCEGLDGVVDVERVAAAILSTGARFIALQEVDRNLDRSGGVDQPAALSELTGLDVRFWPTLRRGTGEYGMAVAAHGATEGELHALPRRRDEEPRAALVLTWEGLTLVATHLSQRRAARRLQLRALAELAGEGPAPAVVLGDLNCSRRELGPLVDAGFHPGPRLATRPGPRRSQIDYIMPGPGVVATTVRTLPEAGSDHFPVVADIRPVS